MVGREYHFRNLILWQRGQELAHDVIQVTKRMPQSWANAVIARQIIASATSVGANIAEGHGRFSIGATVTTSQLRGALPPRRIAGSICFSARE
jgi:hypothetical protein